METLKKIFGSKTRAKLLQRFLLSSDQAFYVRELTRLCGERIHSIRRELENLQSIGLLTSYRAERKKYFKLDPHFYGKDELIRFMKKAASNIFVNQKCFLPIMKNALFVAVSGVYCDEPKAKIDLLFVGSCAKKDLQKFITLEETTKKKEIRYTVFSEKEFLHRARLNDRFLIRFFSLEHYILKDEVGIEAFHLQ